MMNNKYPKIASIARYFFFLIAFHYATFIKAQEEPEPLYEFPLDYANPSLWKSYSQGKLLNFQGDKGGDFTSHTDRFGREGGAILFSSKYAYISRNLDVIPEIDSTKSVTVSFWTYLDNTLSPPLESPPYKTSMKKERFFSLSTDQKSGGLARLQGSALLGVERTVKKGNITKPWYLWLYEPAIVNQKGWYHIVAIMATYYTKVYVYKPDGSKVCSYNYMGNSFPKKIVIGNKINYSAEEENVEAGNIIDDVKVWNVALSEERIQSLHSSDMSNEGENVVSSPPPPSLSKSPVVSSAGHAKVIASVIGVGGGLVVTGLLVKKLYPKFRHAAVRGYQRLQKETESIELNVCK